MHICILKLCKIDFFTFFWILNFLSRILFEMFRPLKEGDLGIDDKKRCLKKSSLFIMKQF